MTHAPRRQDELINETFIFDFFKQQFKLYIHKLPMYVYCVYTAHHI